MRMDDRKRNVAVGKVIKNNKKIHVLEVRSKFTELMNLAANDFSIHRGHEDKVNQVKVRDVSVTANQDFQ